MIVFSRPEPQDAFEILFASKGLDEEHGYHHIVEGVPFKGDTADEVAAQMRALLRIDDSVFSVGTRKQEFGWEFWVEQRTGEVIKDVTRILLWDREKYYDALIGEAFARN